MNALDYVQLTLALYDMHSAEISIAVKVFLSLLEEQIKTDILISSIERVWKTQTAQSTMSNLSHST